MSEHDPNHESDVADTLDVERRKVAIAKIPAESQTGASPDRRLSVGVPSRPLLGRLPLSRIVPQDVHSIMDYYLDAGAALAVAWSSQCGRAKAAGSVLGAGGIVASALTDYRLSLAKLVPIEAHEVIDYAFGVGAISAPFLLGYRKTAPLVAAAHIALGVGTILAALFTDYRSYRRSSKIVAT